MESITLEIKRFLQNKNTVTVLGVILAIFALYFAYTIRVKNAINPISVPYASEQIAAGSVITQSMVSTRLVPPSMLAGDIILDVNEIVDKYAADDTIIPKGSLFYRRTVVEEEQLNRDDLYKEEWPDGYSPYTIRTTVFKTYGNSMVPGNYVDVWVTAVDYSTKKVILGKLISNVKILVVKDGNGVRVFQNLDAKKKPDIIILSLPTEYLTLMTILIDGKVDGADVILVPTNESLNDEPGNTEIASEELKKWISSHAH